MIRVIPILLLQNGALVKSVQFQRHQYIGDPINAVKIFNDKEVDEMMVLDISATPERRTPDLALIRNLAEEAFMPLAYGGGITQLDQIKQLIHMGIEKVVINTAAAKNPGLITAAANWAGSQSLVVSMDVKKNMLGKYHPYTNNGQQKLPLTPGQFARQMEDAGAGEILLQDISKDGSFSGYALDIIRNVSDAVRIPVVAAGGAGSITDFVDAVKAGASAVAAGSMFVLQRAHRAVLMSYPSQEELKNQFFLKV
jgi:cyclase